MNKLQDETILLREAIEQVLAKQTQPLTCVQIAETYEVNSLGLGVPRVTRVLVELVGRKRKPFPIARIPHGGPGHAQWAYYNPTVCQPLAVKHSPSELTGLTALEASAGMQFNGIPEVPAATEAQVQLPPEVQAVTIQVGSVTIRIDLTR